MKMNIGRVQVRVELKRRKSELSKTERIYNNQRAIKHFEENRERVSMDRFFGL